MKTFTARLGQIEKSWFVVDADGKVLGRLAAQVARVLMGKHRPSYTPHVDTGEHVVVVNAGKVRVTGKKEREKVYFRSSGRPGGMRVRTFAEIRDTRPSEIIRLAVRRMLPKTTLGRKMLRKLKVYPGPEHPHAAQKPAALEVRA